MPRSTTKTSPSEVEKRDASPKRKIPLNVVSLGFDHFLKKYNSLNPEILIAKLADSTLEQAEALKCKWRSDLWNFFIKQNASDLLRDFLRGRCMTCEWPIMEGDIDCKSFVDSEVIPISGTALGDSENREYFWNLNCGTKCLAENRFYDGHYISTKPDALVNYYSTLCSSDIFTGESVTVETQNINVYHIQKDLNLNLKLTDGYEGGLTFVSAFNRRFLASQDLAGDYGPVVAVDFDYDNAGGLYFSRRHGFSPMTDTTPTVPPFDCVGSISLAELAWLSAFGAPVELDEDDLDEDVWVDPFYDEEESSDDEEESSDDEDESVKNDSTVTKSR